VKILTAATMKKWFIRSLFGIALLAVTLAGVFTWLGRRPIPVIGGTLTREEQIGIRRLVRREMWKHEFPDHSWKTISHGPRALCELSTARIGLVEILRPNYAEVAVRSRFGIYYYWIFKRSEIWSVGPRIRTPSYSPPLVPSRPKTETEFSGSLSNHAKVSF